MPWDIAAGLAKTGAKIMGILEFSGKLIHLTPVDLEKDSESNAAWQLDSEFLRLMDSIVAFPFTAKQIKDWYEKVYSDRYEFAIRKLDSQEPIGFVELGGINWSSRNAWVGIGIGARENWGQGIGTETMQLILKFGFEELNLRRISLGVLEYNLRAIHSYEKLGFKVEGRQREIVFRDGKRSDMIVMGIFRDQWKEIL
jgi:RimJ/RimL family protein N-acetyltransferase